MCCCFCPCIWVFSSTHRLISFWWAKSHSTVLVIVVYTLINFSGFMCPSASCCIISLVISNAFYQRDVLKIEFFLSHPHSKWKLIGVRQYILFKKTLAEEKMKNQEHHFFGDPFPRSTWPPQHCSSAKKSRNDFLLSTHHVIIYYLFSNQMVG